MLAVTVDSKDNIWIGKWDGGVSLLNKQTKSFVTYTSENSRLSSNNVMDIIEDRKGSLWFATTANANGGGLNKFDKKSGSFTVYTQESNGLVYNALEVIKEDRKGNILVGTYQGFCIFNPETQKSINYVHDSQNENSLSNDHITSFFEEDSVTIWIATVNGLNRLNRITNTFTRYYKTDGLPSSFIFGVEKDDKGFLWISTNGGLSRFDPKTNFFKNYTKEDGLQGNTFIKKSNFRSRDGKVYFGGTNGFNVFDPNQVTDNTYIPPVVITDFKIFNKPVMIGDKGLGNEIGMTEGLVLSYTQSVFSFDFAALNYISSSKNQYAYKMEGFDKEWNFVGTKRTATYTNLDPGKYVFRVKGSNNDGVWNEQGASIRVIITPPFWQTLWFRLILLAVLSGIIYWIYKWRVQVRNLAEKKSLEDAIAKERNLLRVLIDTVPDCIYVKDIESRFVICNTAVERKLGIEKPEQIIGKTDFDFYTPELAAKYHNDDKIVMESGQPLFNHEEPTVDSAGNPKWTLTTKIPLRDSQGQLIGLVGTGSDITERKQMEAALTKERNLLRTLIDNIPDAIYVKDITFRKTIANLADVHNMHLQSEAEVLGKDDFELFPKELAEGFIADDRAVIQTGQPVINREEYVIDEQDQKRWLQTSKLPLRDEKDQIIGLVGIGRDITERKRAEEERERLISELQDALADVKLLSGLVPICASCKKIRDDQGYWTQIESYIQDRSETKFSHSICPDCAQKMYPQYMAKIKEKENPPKNEI